MIYKCIICEYLWVFKRLPINISLLFYFLLKKTFQITFNRSFLSLDIQQKLFSRITFELWKVNDNPLLIIWQRKFHFIRFRKMIVTICFHIRYQTICIMKHEFSVYDIVISTSIESKLFAFFIHRNKAYLKKNDIVLILFSFLIFSLPFGNIFFRIFKTTLF